MIQETMTHVCRVCERTHIVKNGTHRCGNAQDHCKDCGTYRVLKPKQAYAETEQHTVLRLAWSVVACVELHASLPWRGKPLRAGSKRTSRTCLMAKKPFCLRPQMTCSNGMKSGVVCAKKDHQRWLWTAMCRRTRHIVGFAIGERGKATCRRLWESIPDDYKHCHTFSDFWHAYQHVFPAETHHGVGKETGETAHMERWNNTLRQRVGRYVRQTLSFSKSDEYHDMVPK